MGIRVATLLIALACWVTSALADYGANQATGGPGFVTFGSDVISGVHYSSFTLCDKTAGGAQCAAVNSSGQVLITGPVTQSGVWQFRLQDGSGTPINSTAGALSVNIGKQGASNVAGAIPVTMATDQPAIPVNCTAGCTGGSGGGGTSSNFGALFPAAGTAIGLKNGANMVNATADAAGNQNVNIAAGLLPPGPALMSAATPVTMASDQTPIKASTTGNIAAANITGIVVKASAGYVTGVQLGGIGAASAWLKLYNKSTAPICGTDTPVKRLIIPAAATAANGAGSNIPFPAAIYFNNGIGYCVTTGLPDTDTGAPAANTYAVNIDWQ